MWTRPLVAAVQAATGTQHAGDLGQRPLPVAHVVEHVVGDHRIQAAVGHRQRGRVGDHTGDAHLVQGSLQLVM
jgi:hypothetical protein